MPFRCERSAPTNLTDPHKIFHYFEDLEILFAKHNILNPWEKKQAAVYYPSVKVEALWKTTPMFSDPTYSYKDFKAKIIALYPEAKPQHTLEELEKLVADCACTPIRSREEIGEYNCNFLLVSHFLISKNHISWIDQSCYFLASFEPILAMAIHSRLEQKFLDHLPVDPYKTEDIYDAALYALKWQCHYALRTPLTVFLTLHVFPHTLQSPSPAQSNLATATNAPAWQHAASLMPAQHDALLISAVVTVTPAPVLLPPLQVQAYLPVLWFMQEDTSTKVLAFIPQHTVPLVPAPHDVKLPSAPTTASPTLIQTPLPPIHSFLPVPALRQLHRPEQMLCDPPAASNQRQVTAAFRNPSTAIE